MTSERPGLSPLLSKNGLESSMNLATGAVGGTGVSLVLSGGVFAEESLCMNWSNRLRLL